MFIIALLLVKPMLADTLNNLSLSIAASQRLGNLRFQQGQYKSHNDVSDDLLAAMATKCRQRIATINISSTVFSAAKYEAAQQLLDQWDVQALLNSAAIQRLHGILHSKGGHWRQVTMNLPRRDSGEELIHIASKNGGVERKVQQLLEETEQALADHVEPLVVIPLFALQFMKLFPFLDGNRRMLILLIRRLMVLHDHPVACYADLESEFAATEKVFYRSLYQCSRPSSDDEDTVAWLNYWWVLFGRLYQRISHQIQQTNITAGRGSKSQLITKYVRQHPTFQIGDVCQALPTISREQIRTVLRKLRDNGVIEARGIGRSAHWKIINKHNISSNN